jgi:hypothetical protein
MAASSSRAMSALLSPGSLLALSTAAVLAAMHDTAHAEGVQIGDVSVGSITPDDRLAKGKSRAIPVELPGGPDGLATFGWGTPLYVLGRAASSPLALLALPARSSVEVHVRLKPPPLTALALLHPSATRRSSPTCQGPAWPSATSRWSATTAPSLMPGATSTSGAEASLTATKPRAVLSGAFRASYVLASDAPRSTRSDRPH